MGTTEGSMLLVLTLEDKKEALMLVGGRDVGTMSATRRECMLQHHPRTDGFSHRQKGRAENAV